MKLQWRQQNKNWVDKNSFSWNVSGFQMPNSMTSWNSTKAVTYFYHGFYLVTNWFYGTSNIVGYLIPNPLHTYILNIYIIWLGWVLWHINHCRLFNAKSSLYIYTKYIWFALVGFYGISNIVGYLMPNHLYTYILNIYDLFWLGFKAHQPL